MLLKYIKENLKANEPLYLYFCSILVTCRPVGSLCLKICNFENVTASGKSRLWKK